MNLRQPASKLLRQQQTRVAITLVCAALCIAVIGAVFWYQDFRYTRPTPTPPNFHPPIAGEQTPLLSELAGKPGDRRPILLHFFNQDCPCSRFNADQARTLAEKFGDRVRFILVLQLEATAPTAQQQALGAAAKKFGDVEGVVDAEGKIAHHYGVYSTPQAVILHPTGEIVFRGNYNVSRYCTDPGTEFARLALEAVLAQQPPPTLSALAYRAYGCELPQASLR